MKKTIALVAHDNRKNDMIEWVGWNKEILSKHKLICTGTTGKLIKEEFEKRIKTQRGYSISYEPDIVLLKSGPLGGDQQLGAMIAEEKIDIMIFLWDAMTAQPHDVDVKALLRVAVVYNVPMACNRSTADFLISSKLFGTEYKPLLKDYSKYINRNV